MKALIRCGLCLAFGAFVHPTQAQEGQWRLARPASGAAGPGIVVRRPVAVDPSQEGAVTPAAFRAAAGGPAGPVFRAKADEAIRPLPAGASPGAELPIQSDDKLPPEPIPVRPTPLRSGPSRTPGTVTLFGSPATPGPDACEPVICGDCCTPSDCCVDFCCPPRPSSLWLRAEYLLWHLEDQNVPPLVTSAPAGVPPILGLPTTQVLFGDDQVDNDLYSGGRFTVGFWLPGYQDLGIEGSFFFLGKRDGRFEAASNGEIALGRPFVDAVTGLPDFEIVAFAGTTGSVRVDYATRLWGAETNLRYKWCCGPDWHVDLLAGYRHVNLRENLDISENLAPAGGGRILLSDRFGTQNQFNGGQLGIDFERRFWQKWFLGAQLKVALGHISQEVHIGGSTLFLPPGGGASLQPGGFFALPTNIGRQRRDEFAVVPELNLKVGYDVNERLRLFVGYDVMMISDVARPGDQIDPVVNTTQLPTNLGPGVLVGPARPAVLFRTTDFWAQGLNVGVEYRY